MFAGVQDSWVPVPKCLREGNTELRPESIRKHQASKKEFKNILAVLWLILRHAYCDCGDGLNAWGRLGGCEQFWLVM